MVAIRAMKDQYNRHIDYLRVSVTDHCNLRCQYCMPSCNFPQIDAKEILTLDELYQIIELFSNLGIKKIKITGGEPLLRKDLFPFIQMVKNIPQIEEVTMTTNGILLPNYFKEIVSSKLDGINISLDTLDEEKYKILTRGGDLKKVINSIRYLIDQQYPNLKINTVPIQGWNENELISISQLAKEYPIQVRFIELMPIGCGKKFSGVSQESILERLRAEFGNEKMVSQKLGNGPAQYITFDGFKGNIGFIDAIQHKFCKTCNRLRLTSTGYLKLCLQFQNGLDLKPFVKGDITYETAMKQIQNKVFQKPYENKFYEKDDVNFTMNEIGG